MIKTMLSSTMLLLSTTSLVRADAKTPTAAEVAEAEGTLRYQLTTCQVPAALRPYAELLSKRAMQVLVLNTALTPETIESDVARGKQAAMDAMARKSGDWACSVEEMKCLLGFFEERDAAISEILGVASLPKPQEWPASDPNCDDIENGDGTPPQAATQKSQFPKNWGQSKFSSRTN